MAKISTIILFNLEWFLLLSQLKNKAITHNIAIVVLGLFLIKSVTGLIFASTSLSIVDMSANIGVVKRITENRMNILNIIQDNKITKK